MNSLDRFFNNPERNSGLEVNLCFVVVTYSHIPRVDLLNDFTLFSKAKLAFISNSSI